MQLDLADAALAMPEILAPMWIEMCMFGLAMAVYTVFSGSSAPATSRGCTPKSRPASAAAKLHVGSIANARGGIQDLMATAQKGSTLDMLELFQKMRPALAAQCSSCVLSTLAQTPLDEKTTDKLMELAGRFDARALETAAGELEGRRDLEACRQLYQIAGLASVPKTKRALELIVNGHAANPVAMQMLVDEIDAEKVVRLPSRRSLVHDGRAKAAERSRGSRDVQSRAEAIIAHGKDGQLDEAIDVFEGSRQSSGALTTLLFNCLLDACIHCENLATALKYFAEEKEAGLADVVSYNTIMKGWLAKGQMNEAQALLKEMSVVGLSATTVTFHCMLNACVHRGDRRGMWRIVEEMQAGGHRPNAVTCSILLKAIVSTAWSADLQRIVQLVDAVDQTFDEVLFVSLVEASIRAKCLGLLSEKMKSFAARGSPAKLSSPTFGSMIKAYGQARNVQQVRELWAQMIAQQVMPTSITVGCMIEALVMNGCTQEAWELTQRLWEDENQRHTVNTVVYSTILKGFAMTRQHSKVTALYEEMKERGIPRNTITFNTILNSIARCGLMERVPEVLEDMRLSNPKAEPDLVTYSTIIKGYCQSGSVDRALELLRQMCTESDLKPDEVMYNSLLDGCAREQRLEDALVLLAEMREAGVAPSNYTLSILCKLLGRARRLAQAFQMVESVSKECGFQPNIQVYTCLIQACFHNRQVGKALAVHDQIVRDGIVPDEKTYTVLASGCLQAGALEKAVTVVRCAFHLPCGMALTKQLQGMDAKCLRDVLGQLKRGNPTVAHTLDAELQARRKSGPTTRHSPRRVGGRM